MNKKLSCPECDSERIKTEIIKETDVVIFGGQFEYDEILHTCEECGEKGAFSNETIDENHKQFYLALKKANKASLEPIVDDLALRNYSMAYIERALRLPQRTISRWKTKDDSDKGGVSAAGIALMRVIHTYPWVLKVADENFDQDIANKELVNQAWDVISKHFPKPNKLELSQSPEEIEMNIIWSKEGTFPYPISDKPSVNIEKTGEPCPSIA